jgi:hypothetical protein
LPCDACSTASPELGVTLTADSGEFSDRHAVREKLAHRVSRLEERLTLEII